MSTIVVLQEWCLVDEAIISSSEINVTETAFDVEVAWLEGSLPKLENRDATILPVDPNDEDCSAQVIFSAAEHDICQNLRMK